MLTAPLLVCRIPKHIQFFTVTTFKILVLRKKKKAKTYSDECAASDTVEQRVVSAENVSGLCGQGKDTAEVPTATVGLGMLRTCSSVHTGTLEPIAAP